MILIVVADCAPEADDDRLAARGVQEAIHRWIAGRNHAAHALRRKERKRLLQRKNRRTNE